MSKLLELLESDAKLVLEKIDFSELNNKKILLTGASGLLGTHLLVALFLLNKSNNLNIEVSAVIRSKPLSIHEELFGEKNITMLSGDLTSSDFLKEIPISDYIIHSAGYAQPSIFMSNPIKTIQLNTSTTIELLNRLNKNGKFVFMSSSEVYSGLEKVPFSENDIGTTNTNHPRSCYIEGKRCGEAIVNAYRENGVNAKSIRLSLAYGPGTRTDDSRVMSNFIQKAIKNKKIEMLDNGAAKRTYSYISDVVEYVFHILLKGSQNVYNVGGYSGVTISELAKKIGSIYNIPVIYPTLNNEVKGSPKEVKIDISRAEAEFGKKAYINFDCGLINTIKWYDELFKHNE